MDNVIFEYTREQAIADGVLFDASAAPEAQEAGFRAPLALTTGVMQHIDIPKGLEGMQDVKGRLWDTLFLAATAFTMQKRQHEKNPTPDNDPHLCPFVVRYQTSAAQHEDITLWIAFNEYEGFTIMLPSEY